MRGSSLSLGRENQQHLRIGNVAKNCRTCSAELVQSSLPALNGRFRDWQVRLVNYPVLGCPQGHELREVYPDFNYEWSDALAYETRDVWLKPVGLLRGDLACRLCGASTQTHQGTTVERVIHIQTRGTQVFDIVLAGPLLRCSGCGHLWAKDRDSSDIFESLANALSDSGIRRY